ncbi:MAG: SusC/RagA family TonB-linked outer membrane protein [Bacteroidales bacterium]|nr:SusC/RagA family TonB-linked outer membrane protein [Bacteroidales bacterium]
MRKFILLIGIVSILYGEMYASKTPDSILIESTELRQKNAQVEGIIKKLENKFHVFITYESSIFNNFKLTNSKSALGTANIEDAFAVLFKGSSLTYKKIRKDFYVIIKTDISINYNPKDTVIVITGTVYDETNMELPGASILVRETTNGTVTDLDGNFSLKISSSAETLIFRFIGYKTVVEKIENKTNFKIHLVPEAIGLDEIVVSGVAGKTSMKKLTVTVAKINADELNEAPASSAATSLQGKIAGVKITQAYGTPGSGASIRLRGSTSITGNQAPLILVDGNIFESSLADINVDDIQSIEVVKGAAAASLYGSKAGSGVILITTNRGNNLEEGKTQIKVRNEYGSSSITKNIELSEHHPYELSLDYKDFDYFTKYEGVRYNEDGSISRGSRRLEEDHISDNEYGFINNNQDNFFNPGSYYTNYISMANRSAKTNIFMSFENNKQSGILFSTKGYNRQNFRVNIDHYLNEKIKISTSNLLISTNSDNPGSTNSFFDLLFLSPDVDLEQENEDGSSYKIKPDPWSIEENPLYPLYYRERTSTKTTLLSNIIINYELFEWLNFNTKYTIEKQSKDWSTFTPRGYLYGGGQTIDGSIYMEQYSSSYQTFQTTANFNKIFNQLTVKAKISYLYEDKNYHDFWVTGRDFLTANIPQLNNTNAELSSMSSYEGIIRAENIFGIVDFDYKDRYLFSALYRKDGSSLFGVNERWNDYYRVSAAYRISQDIKIPGIDELKIRAAYGTAGQRPGFSYQYETWSISNGALQKSTLGNNDLKPSESEELELALDATIMNRVDLQLSYSKTDTKDVFALAPLASHLGYPGQWKNVGTLSTWSYEAALGLKIIEKNNLNWKVNLTFDRIRQQITKLNIPEYKTGPKNAFLIKEGETLGAIYGYRWLTSLEEMSEQLMEGQSIDDYVINSDGYVITDGTEGSINESAILWDKDANGVADLTKIGDGNPEFNLGLSSTLSWRNIQLYALFDWKNGGDIYNYTHQYTFRDGRAIEFDQFDKPDEEKKTIDYYSTFYYHTALNSYFIEDASYVKLRELSLYYTISAKNIEALQGRISSIRLGVIGHNMFTFTNYSGYDPEVASGTDLSNFPFDDFGYPNYRTISASIEIKF